MGGEGPTHDYKVSFDIGSPKAKLELVRDILAISNSGGGTIIFGHDEVSETGITNDVVQALDSAKVAEWIRNFSSPAPINLSHEVRSIGRGKYILTLTITGSRFPLVVSKQGYWKGANRKRERPVFEVGDIWVRHSSRTERATYEDLRQWILNAIESERESILDRITTLVNLPDGVELQLVSQAGQPIDSPGNLLENAIRRREHNSDHLLSTHDLLWLFQFRENCEYNERNLSILIASALRRNPTLYWWLLKSDCMPEVIEREITSALNASDRDKSDAAHSIVEVASIYLSTPALRETISALKSSRYAHFRREGEAWNGRRETLSNIKQRIRSSKIEGKPILSLGREEMEAEATQCAARLLRSKSISLSRRLSDLTRAIWSIETGHI
ncbi:MAG: ATP-binding protein [bacterium]|nr:MAG: ATP-binding protein [bacterium]